MSDQSEATPKSRSRFKRFLEDPRTILAMVAASIVVAAGSSLYKHQQNVVMDERYQAWRQDIQKARNDMDQAFRKAQADIERQRNEINQKLQESDRVDGIYDVALGGPGGRIECTDSNGQVHTYLIKDNPNRPSESTIQVMRASIQNPQCHAILRNDL